MKKNYKYFILILVVLFMIIFLNIFRIYKNNNTNEVENNGSTLSERFLNLYKVVNEDSGLYKYTNKYVFKGNPNNYIEFNDELWRIVSLDKDGSVKIVRNNLLNYEKDYETALEYLNSEYYDSLSNKEFILEHDFDITSYDIGKFVSEESLNEQVSNNTIKYYVGLLDVIEIANATTYVTLDEYLNIFFWINRNSNYLYLPEKWLTITPEVYVNYDFLKEDTNIVAKIRPSLYLKPDLKISYGDGTKNNPYKVEKEL